MKIIVDKLPARKEDCLFCFQETGSIHKSDYHKCFFKISEHEFKHGLQCSSNNCFLSQGLRCPYLKKLFSQEDNDRALFCFDDEIVTKGN